MHILLVADGRSPITRRWVNGLIALEHQVTLVTTFPCEPVPGVDADVCLPVAFASAARTVSSGTTQPLRISQVRRLVTAFRPLFQAARYRLGPLTLLRYGPRFRWLVERIRPDVVHALRIPYEGMLASYTPPGIPLAVSIWGNDLTLHARATPEMARRTRAVLARANALHTDAERDVRLARAWGFAANHPALVVPGSGGLVLSEMDAIRNRIERQEPPLVINPRGFRTGSVRQDTFFAAVPLVLEQRPETAFACAAMAGQREALAAVDQFGLHGKVDLLPLLPQHDLWSLLARASATISVSQHDGTPNSLLEAMALGTFPIAGDIQSIREWITPGVNGLLVEPDSPRRLADAILQALADADLRRRAAQINRRMIEEKATVEAARGKIQAFYETLV
jgi:glycosyltransferase involved in cell wall biosynthesis